MLQQIAAQLKEFNEHIQERYKAAEERHAALPEEFNAKYQCQRIIIGILAGMASLAAFGFMCGPLPAMLISQIFAITVTASLILSSVGICGLATVVIGFTAIAIAASYPEQPRATMSNEKKQSYEHLKTFGKKIEEQTKPLIKPPSKGADLK